MRNSAGKSDGFKVVDDGKCFSEMKYLEIKEQ